MVFAVGSFADCRAVESWIFLADYEAEVARHRGREVEPGCFMVLVGASSEDIRLEESFEIVGGGGSREPVKAKPGKDDPV